MIGSVDDIPTVVADDERLHRRIAPEHCKPDGSISSAAFNHEDLSVDRALYRDAETTLEGYPQHGLARLLAMDARQLGQAVIADKLLLNPAHALIQGKKSKGTARALARAAEWVIDLPTA